MDTTHLRHGFGSIWPSLGALSLGLLSTLLTVTCLAHSVPERTNLSDETRLCVFDKPLEVGASVTAQIGSVVPIWGPFTALFYGARSGPYGGSPSSDFISHYRNRGLLFAAPQYKVGNKMPESIARFTTITERDTGSGQVESLLTGENKELFQKSSLIIGVDLFYWDAIWDLCEYEENPQSGSEFQMIKLIKATRDSGKILMLGNIPHEDASLVKVNSGVPEKGIWWPQTSACVDSINQTLSRNCTIENRCYLVDMVAMPQLLGKDFSYEDIRPDGVHLSRLGSELVAKEMIKKFENNPPQCSHKKVTP